MRVIKRPLGRAGPLAVLTAALVLGVATMALANPDPETFSLDNLSLSGLSGAALLNPGGPPPTVQLQPPLLGLLAADELDAVSPGIDAVQRDNILYFSVDRSTMGLPGPLTPLDVAGQAIRNQQAADIFVTTNQIGVAAVPMGINMLRDNQTLMGAQPLLPPMVFNTGAAQDNLDALTFEEFDLDGDGTHDMPVYFSLRRGSPTLGTSGNSAADILLAPAGQVFGVFAPAASMGLDDGDDLDALVLLDAGMAGAPDPGLDIALFSLAPGSPTLVAGGLSAADIFMTTFNGASFVRYPSTALALCDGDNVDALEVQIPEPTCLAVLIFGATLAGFRKRRR